MNNYKEDIRYLAHFVVETNTPMAIGSGEKGLTVDRLIARDANGLPYIPGTSMAGVVRHELEDEIMEEDVNDIFGFQGYANNGNGSRINFSAAVLVSGDGKHTALEDLHNIDFKQGYYSFFNRLPERDHVRISHRGTADTLGHGKFDEELVHKGTRFVFEIELEGTSEDEENWEVILSILHNSSFRIGAGTRKGFGGLKIIECKTKVLDLNKSMSDYLSISSSLNKDLTFWEEFTPNQEEYDDKYYHYKISLIPENVYIFGAGIGDEEVDMTPKTERFFDWSNGTPVLSEETIIIPATSIKGALSHRVAFHYNKFVGLTIDKNTTEFNHIDEDELVDSLADINSLESEIFQLVNEIESFKSIDLQHNETLQELKENLEAKKMAINKFAKELKELDVNNSIESSSKWNNYQQDLEDQEKQFSELESNVSELNEGVKQLFGYAKNTKKKRPEKSDGLRGRVIISDVYLDEKSKKVSKKVFDHVAIDRFTGGGIDGALYQEKAISSDGFVMDIYVEKQAFDNKFIKVSLEEALNDLINGNIQLGGNTGKGHGVFIGSYELLNAE